MSPVFRERYSNSETLTKQRRELSNSKLDRHPEPFIRECRQLCKNHKLYSTSLISEKLNLDPTQRYKQFYDDLFECQEVTNLIWNGTNLYQDIEESWDPTTMKCFGSDCKREHLWKPHRKDCDDGSSYNWICVTLLLPKLFHLCGEDLIHERTTVKSNQVTARVIVVDLKEVRIKLVRWEINKLEQVPEKECFSIEEERDFEAIKSVTQAS